MRKLAVSAMVIAVTLFAITYQAKAHLINLCLSGNGGVLEDGAEAMRDGDFAGQAQWGGGQSGELTTKITFPVSHLEYVKYRIDGGCFEYDGGATLQLDVDLEIDGSWTTIFNWSGSGWQHYDTGIAYDDNGGNGWGKTSGILCRASFWGSDTGSAGATFYEAQAWAIPEPATLSLLAIGGLAVLRRGGNSSFH